MPGVTSEAASGDTATSPEPPVEPPEEPPARDPVDRVFDVWLELEEPKNPTLTPSRRRVIEKGLKEATPEECIAALRGRRVWLDAKHGADAKLELSSVFQTGPHSRGTLREQIEFYLEQAPDQVDAPPSGFPSASSARIERAKDEVRAAAEMDGSHTAQVRGERAMEWLKEHGIGVRYDDGVPLFEPLPPPSEGTPGE